MMEIYVALAQLGEHLFNGYINICMENIANTKISSEWDGVKRTLFEKPCKSCGNCFWIPKHKIAVQHYCSQFCSGKNRQNKIAVICSNCNKDFFKTASILKKSRHQKFFCNRLCKDTAQKLGGNCPEIRPDHYGTGNGVHSYRNKINIDSCIDCGENRLWTLSVHHIDGDRKNNNIENLEVVCQNCHNKRHLVLIDEKWCFNTKHLTPRELLKNL